MNGDGAETYTARSPRRRRVVPPARVERLESRTLCASAAGDEAPLAAWFRADAITAPAGSAVAQWADSSGRRVHATQANPARQPRFIPDGLNGRPSVRFDAAAATQLAFARPVSGDFTIVVVFGSRQGLGSGEAWYGGAGIVDGEVGGVTDDFGVSLNRHGQVLAGTGDPDTFAASGMGFDDGRAHVATFTRSASTGQVTLHVDGRLLQAVAASTQPLTASPRLTIGSLQTNINYLTGDIGEIRVYSAALPDAARAAVEGELSDAYNVAAPPTAWFANPVYDRNFPDPGVVYAGGTYYAFATNGNGRNVQAASSANLVDWTTLPDALPALPPWALAGRTWAPDVTAVGNGQTYNLYYTAWHRTTGRQVIGVATSTNPAGPFTPAGAAPLVTQTNLGGAIDPSVFTDAGGTRYLLWKNDGNAIGQDTWIYVQQLAVDGLSFVGSSTRLIRQDQAWEGNLVEGPVLWARNGRYYLFYSANNFANGAYATGYAVSTSLRGPYAKAPEPIAQTEGDVVGPGGPEIVVGPDGNDWMLYHSWEDGTAYRSMSVDRLDWDGLTPDLRGPSRETQPVPVRPAVVGRYAFYNNSFFDGQSPSADARDDVAIATDKSPLLAGRTATFANVTSYARGINGIMVDVSALPRETTGLSATAFVVRVGTGGDPATWSAGPVPTGVTVRLGEGAGGSDRVTLVWADGAIRNAWVQVTVPTQATGLAASDVFAFGNLVGETGEGNRAGAVAQVDAFDVFAVRRRLFSASPVTSRYDFDRDGRVSAADLVYARSNLSRRLTAPGVFAPIAVAYSAPAPRDEEASAIL